MDSNSTNLERLQRLRAELGEALRGQPRDREKCLRILAEVKRLSAITVHHAACPFCGRRLEIPPCETLLTLGCKRCRNVFVYDPINDHISASRAPLRRNSSRRNYWLAALGLTILLLAAGAAALLFHKLPSDHLPPAPVGEPGPALEEIQKQLKSLSE